MYYYTKEQATNVVKQKMENYRAVIEIINEAKEVVRKFDGKVINKRFETALCERTGEVISVRFSYYRIEIELFACACGKSRVTVNTSTQFNLCIFALQGGAFDAGCGYNKNWTEVTEVTSAGNHRLIAERLIEAMNRSVEYYEAKIAENAVALDNVDKYEAMYQEMKRLEKELNSVPYDVREAFDLIVSVQCR